MFLTKCLDYYYYLYTHKPWNSAFFYKHMIINAFRNILNKIFLSWENLLARIRITSFIFLTRKANYSINKTPLRIKRYLLSLLATLDNFRYFFFILFIIDLCGKFRKKRYLPMDEILK